jgi:hypothetical protein
MTRKTTSLKIRLQETKQTWEEARMEALAILNASYDERHGPCAGDDSFHHFTDEMIDISIEEGYSDQPPGHCRKLFLKLNGGPDLRTIRVEDDLNDDVGEQLHDIGFDEVTVEQIDGIDLSWFDTHRAAPKPKKAKT